MRGVAPAEERRGGVCGAALVRGKRETWCSCGGGNESCLGRESPPPSRCAPRASLGSAGRQWHSLGCGEQAPAGPNARRARRDGAAVAHVGSGDMEVQPGGAVVAELRPGAGPAGWEGAAVPGPPPPRCCLSSLLMATGTARPLHGGTRCKKTRGLLHTENVIFSAHGQQGRQLSVANPWLLPYRRAWGSFIPPRGLQAGTAPSASSSACPPGQWAEVQPPGSCLNPGLGLLHQKCCTLRADNEDVFLIAYEN